MFLEAFRVVNSCKNTEIGIYFGVPFFQFKFPEMADPVMDLYDFSQPSYFWINPG
jgi:hypothetical protein